MWLKEKKFSPIARAFLDFLKMKKVELLKNDLNGMNNINLDVLVINLDVLVINLEVYFLN